MKKRNVSKAVFLATSISIALLPSSGVNAFGLSDLAKATKFEQLKQIAQADEQLGILEQMLSTSDIGGALMGIFDSSQEVNDIVETVLNYDVPERLVTDHDVLSTEQYAALNADRLEYLEQLDADIDELSTRVSIDQEEASVMAEIAALSAAPPSDISATQVQILQDASKIKEDKRQKALEILRGRRDDIRQRVIDADQHAHNAAMRCFWDSKKCGY